MPKIAVVILADTETHEGAGRVANALELAKEGKNVNDEVEIIFDGAGTKWARDLSDPDHRMRPLYDAVKDRVIGACAYCARAFGVAEALRSTGVPLLEEFDGHPSLRKRFADGYQVITF